MLMVEYKGADCTANESSDTREKGIDRENEGSAVGR